MLGIANDPFDGLIFAPGSIAFYLILDVAIGGTNGWFPDAAGNKPWLNGELGASDMLSLMICDNVLKSGRRCDAQVRPHTGRLVFHLAD